MADKLIRGAAFGAAAVITAALFVPAVAEAARPLARRGMKLAILAFLQGRETVAHVMEMAEDAYAEACAELKEQAESMTRTESAEADAAPETNKHEIAVESKSRHQ
jgi:hypothetical protein